MKLSAHFTLAELTVSDTAKSRGIDNAPTPEHLGHMTRYLAPGLEQVREICGGHAVTVHSAYRNPEVNKIVGGTPTSDHPQGYAGDVTVAGQSAVQTARLIAAAMKAGKIKVDQLILESSRGVVHVSFNPRARGMMGHQPAGPGTPIDWGYFK